MRLTARVPATSANLGPGFDCFGLALDLCNDVTLDTDAEPRVTWEGEGEDELPTDGTDVVSRAMRATFERQARLHPEASLPPYALHGLNRIPIERGLGSSSAAAVAGAALASALLGPAGFGEDRYATFACAAELEGHPDNAAPAVYGGLTVIADGRVRRFEVAPEILPAVLIPSVRLPTGRAREVLPERVPLVDAVANVAHGALVVQALVRGDLDLLQIALRDRLHQAARLALVPQVREVFEHLERSMPVCVSGAGPSLLAFPSDPSALPELGEGWRVLRLPARSRGVEVARDPGEEPAQSAPPRPWTDRPRDV
ncbi:MAG TPA: homoserine kinase [Actinomycetota bacterium]|nr:homoserine kinase [Actinomycetota bacterium]